MTRYAWPIALGITVLTWGASAAVYPSLPDRVAIHWNWKGEVDGYGPRQVAAFLGPAIMLVMLGVFRALPWLSPKRFEIEPFRRTYEYLVVVITGLMAYLHGVILYGATHALDVGRVAIAGALIALVFLGNVLGRVRPNFFVGIRTPWTIASERVWVDTHRVAAWTFVGGSLLGLVLTLAGAPMGIVFVLVMLSALSPAVYSLVHYKRLERRGEIT